MEYLVWILIAVTCQGFSYADDLPCNTRPTLYGYVCVCNSSYCDTVERPPRLPSGQFHRYTTSSTSPGFTHTLGHFSEFSSDAEYVFTVNNSMERQEYFGTGGSFTDSVGMLWNNLSVETQEKFMESYFGPNGIEYSMARVPIGSSDFSPRVYTFDDVPNDYELKYFSLTDEEYNYKIPLIQKALSLSERGLQLIGCTWNAPAWMKLNNSTSDGYIRRSDFSTWAKYHIKFLDEYKREGLEFWGLSGGNEVVLAVSAPGIMPVASTAMQQRDWFKNHLKPQLIAANYSDVKLIALEDQRLYALYYMDRFAEDPEAYRSLDAIALHWYSDMYIPPKVLDYLHEYYPEKYILYTESSVNVLFGNVTVELGGWTRGEIYAHHIIECWNHWTQAYLDWNLGLNTEGGPNIGMNIDAAVIINTTSGEFYKQPIFYVLGHFSKFIPPGSKVVQVDNHHLKTGGLMTDKDFTYEPIPKVISERKIKDDYPMPVPKTVQCTATANSDGSYSVFVLNTKNTTTSVQIEVLETGTIAWHMEPHSLVTFVYWT